MICLAAQIIAQIRAHHVAMLVVVALSSPAERGLPFTTWLIPKRAEHCREHKVLPEVTDEWVRRPLRRERLTAQRVRTWKTSNADGAGRSQGSRRERT
jgi:hypothetical protein